MNAIELQQLRKTFRSPSGLVEAAQESVSVSEKELVELRV